MAHNERIDMAGIRNAAHGKWASIFAALAGDKLGSAVKMWGKKVHVDCPSPNHGGAHDFRIFEFGRGGEYGAAICTCRQWKDGIELLCDLYGYSIPEAFNRVAEYLGIGNTTPGAIPPPRELTAEEKEAVRLKQEEKAREDYLLKVKQEKLFVGEALLLEHQHSHPVRAYLRRRKIWDPQWANHKFLRCHPSLPYWGDGDKGRWPVFIAQTIANEDKLPVSFHRIYLTRDGRKAELTKPKMTYSTPSDRRNKPYAVRLTPAGRILGVGEGLETCMAVRLATGMPMWSCLVAGNLQEFTPPRGVEEVVIWADYDRSGTGIRAAKKLQLRLVNSGLKAKILIPSGEIPEGKKGIDWGDVWEKEGYNGFPFSIKTRRANAPQSVLA